MASILPDDILLPTGADPVERRPGRSRVVAFVPITIAFIGVAAILLGRVTVHEVAASDVIDGLDPIATGSIEKVSPGTTDGSAGTR